MDCNGSSWFRGPVIGKGSFGCVFMAKPSNTNSFFPPVMAVKSAEVSASASLQKEKEILDNLHGCPFVLECFGEETTMGQTGDMAYNLLLEYASGGALEDMIKKSNGCGLPEEDVRRFTKCILEGLSYIHDCGYIHCDLKPDNILLVKNQSSKLVAKICDLGLAKRWRQGKRQIFDPSMRGTPLYMAPETVVEHLQERPSDIWALGCVVLEMLTGRTAWDVNQICNVEHLFWMIGDEDSLPEIPSEISEEGKNFLKRCFVRNPRFRFTAKMLLENPFVQGFDEEDLFRDLNSDGEESLCIIDVDNSSSCSDDSGFISLEATITREELWPSILIIPAFAR